MRVTPKARGVSKQKSRSRSYCQYSEQCSLHHCTGVDRGPSEGTNTMRRSRQLSDMGRENLDG